jgi:pimeloyl-ACP methyl ester carboxylesterase
MLIEQRRAKGGSSDYNRATPMMRAILSKCVNEDLCRVMPKVSAPVLLFWGDRDTATPLSDAHKMERLMPNAGLVVAQGAGHFAMLEQPALWEATLKSFLNIE